MSTFEFKKWIKQLEKQATDYPRLYLAKVVILLGLGMGYLYLMFAIFLVLFLMMVLLFFKNPLGAIKFAVIFGSLIYMLGKAFRVKWDRPTGIEITESEAPELFKELRFMQEQLKSLKIHRVLLVDDFNAYVTQHPRFGILGGYQNYLMLGLPLMYSMSKDAFRSVLAHELGHLSKSHGRFGAWIYRTRAAWSRIMKQFDEQDQFGAFLFRWFVKWFAPRINAYTFVLARQEEYEADRIARSLTSKEAVGEGLCQLNIYGNHIRTHFWGKLIEKTKTQIEPPNAYSEMRRYFAAPIEADTAQALLDGALEVKTDFDDTHPCLAERLRAVGVESRVPKPVTKSAASAFLGGQEEHFTSILDEQWKECLAERWKQDYEEILEKRERLGKYRDRVWNELSPNQQFDFARLIEELENEREALAKFELVLESNPDDVDSYVATGILTLKLGLKDQFVTAIERLKKAMAMDHEYTFTCCQAMIDHYRRMGDEERVEHYIEIGNRYMQQREQSNEERSTCSPDDTYVPHELPAYVFTRLKNALKNRAHLKSAYLIRKQVKLFPERPMYVLLLDFHIPYTEEKKPFSRQMTDEILKMEEIPSGSLLVNLTLDKPLRKLVRIARKHPAGTLVVPVSAWQRWNPIQFYRNRQTARLFNGISQGNIKKVRSALAQGADLHETVDYWMPMFLAAGEGNIEMMELFLQKGVDINAQNADGNTALFFAANHNHVEAVEWMLARGADPNIRYNSGRSLLSSVCMNGHAVTLSKLLAAGAKTEFFCYENEYTPLMIASFNGQLECVDQLLQAGANVNARSKDGSAALGYAEKCDQPEVAALLRKYHAVI